MERESRTLVDEARQFIVDYERGSTNAHSLAYKLSKHVVAEAARLDALSVEDYALASSALDAHDPSGNGPSAWVMLRSAGLAIVRVRS